MKVLDMRPHEVTNIEPRGRIIRNNDGLVLDGLVQLF